VKALGKPKGLPKAFTKTEIEGENPSTYVQVGAIAKGNFIEYIYLERPAMGSKGVYSTLAKGNFSFSTMRLTKIRANLMQITDAPYQMYIVKHLNSLRDLQKVQIPYTVNKEAIDYYFRNSTAKEFVRKVNELLAKGKEFSDAEKAYMQDLLLQLKARESENTNSVSITESDYTIDYVRANTDTAFVFTENTYSITAFPTRNGGGSALIRPEPNAFAIVTKKKYDYNTRENVDYSDSDSDFKEFVDINTKLLDKLKNSNKSKIVFPKGFATDKASMPTRFALWLQKELLNKFGLVTELNPANTGLISKSVNSRFELDNLWDSYKTQILQKNPNAKKEDLEKQASQKGMQWLKDYLNKCYV
jgi:hypothetical protein